jgi:hypothetical protein
MRYENPDVPHEVNVARGNPLSEFIRLAAALAVLITIGGAALYLGGGRLARLIPFATEKSWVGDEVLGLELKACGAAHDQIEAYVTRLGAELGRAMDLPSGMTIETHYTALDVPNAFATLGGHIVVTSGLYGRLPSENALAMVIAHEIGHVKARDPISALGGSAAISVTLALLTGQNDGLAPHMARVVQLNYSRRAERRADEEAISALKRHYGHAGGGAALFQVLANYQPGSAPSIPSLLSTHPSDTERIARVEAAAAGWDPVRTPLVAIEVPPDSGLACRTDMRLESARSRNR